MLEGVQTRTAMLLRQNTCRHIRTIMRDLTLTASTAETPELKCLAEMNMDRHPIKLIFSRI